MYDSSCFVLAVTLNMEYGNVVHAAIQSHSIRLSPIPLSCLDMPCLPLAVTYHSPAVTWYILINTAIQSHFIRLSLANPSLRPTWLSSHERFMMPCLGLPITTADVPGDHIEVPALR